MPGTLHVVATPIGNLEDITLRALKVLAGVDAIACEDTRTTSKLLARHSIRKPLVALYGRSGAAIVDRLKAGESIAVVSESGTPGISDPGADLVAAAHAAGAKVTVVPGPCAAAAAAGASGLPADRFLFEGFLPRKPGKRRKVLESLAREPRTLVFYESPHRVADTLEAMREALGDRRITIARELTKIYEEIRPTTLSEAVAALAKRPPRGEYVLVVAGAPKRARLRADSPEEE